MGGTRAYLDGRPLFGAVSWALTSGVRPFQTVVYLSHADADALTGRGGTGGSAKPRPVELKFAGGDPERNGTFRGVYVLHRVASPIPWHAAVLISDRRWLWSYATYRRHMNVRRKVGTLRLTSPNQLDATNLEPRLAYATWSLHGGNTPWTASTLLDDLAAAIADWERAEMGASVAVTRAAASDAAQSPIQDLELDGQLDESIERALSYLPGMDVTVDADGGVRFFQRADFGAENDEVEQARQGGQTQSGGHIEPVTYAGKRPRKVRVWFSVEAEMRLDFSETEDDGATTDVTDDQVVRAQNVLPVPDASLSVGGQTVYTGTWITMQQAFTAWGAAPGLGGVLTFPRVRRAGVPFNNLWNVCQMTGAEVPDQDWVGRIGAVMTHFRRTYRITKHWMDRFSEIRAYRVATINTETGTRGDASVWSDYAYLPTQRSMRAEANNSQDICYVMNVAIYPSGGLLTDESKASPATVTILDSDQGVFTVSYNADPTRLYEQALPSQVEIEGTNTQPGTLVAAGSAGPSPYLRRSTRGFGWNLLGRFQQPATLTSNHKIIVILTVVPASPNSKRGLCFVDVYPGEVPSFPGQGNCNGPMQEVRVGPGLEVARIAWLDAAKARILALFSEQQGDPLKDDAEYPLADLVVNYSGDAAGGASLRGIAIAEAARIYHAQRDRQLGSATFGFRAAARLAGAMTAVHHDVGSDGTVLTRIDLPGRIEPLSVLRYLSASARRIILRLVNPGT